MKNIFQLVLVLLDRAQMLGGVTKDKGTCAPRPSTPSGPKKGQNEHEASLATSTTPNVPIGK